MTEAAPATALVTGVGGFLGSHLAERLIGLGHRVIGVDCFTPYYDRGQKEANLTELTQLAQFRFVELDLARGDATGLVEGQEWVFHLAAQPGVRASWDRGFALYVEHNLLATQRLLETCRRARISAFVFASSSSVYGEISQGKVTEDAPLRPVSPYGVTKLAAEHLVQVYHHTFGLPTVSLRYFTVCGPRQRPDMAFHRLLRAMYRDEEFLMNGDGSQARDFTYVSDAVEATLLAAGKGRRGGVYNVGGGTPHSLQSAVEILETCTGRSAKIRRLPPAEGDPHRTAADLSRARAELGYVPQVPLKEALRREADWFAGPQGPPAREGWA